jgi:hypothetical protein
MIKIKRRQEKTTGKSPFTGPVSTLGNSIREYFLADLKSEPINLLP